MRLMFAAKRYARGRSSSWLKVKNPDAPAMRRPLAYAQNRLPLASSSSVSSGKCRTCPWAGSSPRPPCNAARPPRTVYRRVARAPAGNLAGTRQPARDFKCSHRIRRRRGPAQACIRPSQAQTHAGRLPARRQEGQPARSECNAWTASPRGARGRARPAFIGDERCRPKIIRVKFRHGHHRRARQPQPDHHQFDL